MRFHDELKVKLVIGFITYGNATAKYLPYFLPSITEATENIEGAKFLAVDNSEESSNENLQYIKNSNLDIEIIHQGENLGFAKAHNLIITKARELGAEYYLAINTDIILESDAIQKMTQEIQGNSELGSVCPKIMQWDFKDNKKTNIIDSLGIALKPGLRFVDLGQGQVDNGQFHNANILGPSGACAIYSMAALEKVKESHNHAPVQYFDELMFMYKEDCDLAYRLNLAGFKAECVTGALVYHDRSVKARGESNLQIAINRRYKSRQEKKWSFLNQYIIFVKYWRLQNWKSKFFILIYDAKMFLFALIFEQYLLSQYKKLWKIKDKIKVYK